MAKGCSLIVQGVEKKGQTEVGVVYTDGKNAPSAISVRITNERIRKGKG